MRVLKVVAEGLTTSFRYPHFMQQIHPTFEMPPPATIYGHICSTLGEWVSPDGLRFAYHFTHAGKRRDIEHTIVLSGSTGKVPGTNWPKVLEGNVNPFEREILFLPRLTLYINRPQWEAAFRSPRYAVALGRSQDLFTYTHVDVIELQQAERAYFEHTLLPYAMIRQVGQGVAVLMPRFLDYERNRAPTFGRYTILTGRTFLPNDEQVMRFSDVVYGPYWVDPTAPVVNGVQRGLAFLAFIGEDDGSTLLA